MHAVLTYIDLARVKSEALGNIKSLLKQNMQSSNAKRRRQRNRSNYQKSNFAPAAHFFCSFLCRCFARLQRETSRNFVVARFMEEMVVRLVNFFTASHIHLGGH